MAQRGRIILWGVAGVLLAAVAVVAVMRVWPLLHPPALVRAALDPGCDLRQGPCTATFADGATVSLSVTPRHLPPLAPLRLEVTVEGLTVTGKVAADITGLNMNMGFNRPELAPAGAGRWVGEALIPICTLTRMDWEAVVLLPTADGLRGAPFRFSTFRADLGR